MIRRLCASLTVVLLVALAALAWAQTTAPANPYPLKLSITLAVGGAIGAIIRRWRASDEGNAIKLYVTDAVIAAFTLPLLQLVGTMALPESVMVAAQAAPAIAFCVAASISYMGIDLLTPLSKGWQGKT